MTTYGTFFYHDKKPYRLPVNPESISTSSNMEYETYEVLRLGQVVVPTHMELKEYSFEVEIPNTAYSYTKTKDDFKGVDYYMELFQKWQKDMTPIRFIASNGITDDINSLVVISEMEIEERAGEESDKYVTFTLKEYREFGKIAPPKVTANGKKKKATTTKTNPNNKGYYVVKSGDCLWNISKKYYGDATQYMKIYNANKDKIKKPALIYPGQKLVIPK